MLGRSEASGEWGKWLHGLKYFGVSRENLKVTITKLF
jgi:hypothetical protein